MLFFTHREVVASATDDGAFSSRFAPMASRLGRAEVAPVTDAAGEVRWSLSDVHADDGDASLLAALVARFRRGRPVLVYVHGNNYTPARAFSRCQRLAELYAAEVIGFSWTSEGLQPDGSELAGLDTSHPGTDGGDDDLGQITSGNRAEGWIIRKIRHYRQAKANAQDATHALARFLRLVAAARLQTHEQPLTLAAHSLGCHFLQKAIEIDGVQSSLAAATNVLLLAACASRERHAAWVGRIRPAGQLFITFNQGDSVLAGANVADSGDVKLGTDPGSDLVLAPYVRYIDFSGSPVNLGGHGYFVAAPGHQPAARAYRLFGRLFTGQRDFGPGEAPRDAYPLGCNEARSLCYMGAGHDGAAAGGPN